MVERRTPTGAGPDARRKSRSRCAPSEAGGADRVVAVRFGAARRARARALASQLVELFAWDINFYTDTHPGDRWRVVVEKQYLDDQFYRYGRILAAEYSGRAVGTFRAFAYGPGAAGGPVHYYDERGQAIAKSFLKTPLRFVRISSKFDRKRFHPILHRTKAHLGVDYAAPAGHADLGLGQRAGGRVRQQARLGQHRGHRARQRPGHAATTTCSASPRACGSGRQVRQKDLIGYVGTTGPVDRAAPALRRHAERRLRRSHQAAVGARGAGARPRRLPGGDQASSAALRGAGAAAVTATARRRSPSSSRAGRGHGGRTCAGARCGAPAILAPSWCACFWESSKERSSAPELGYAAMQLGVTSGPVRAT